MTFSISGAVPGQPANPYTPAPAATQPAPQPQQSGDTVALSQSAQINQLNMLGQSATEIAEALGISISTVDSDLGIVTANVTSTSSAPVPDATTASATSAQST